LQKDQNIRKREGKKEKVLTPLQGLVSIMGRVCRGIVTARKATRKNQIYEPNLLDPEGKCGGRKGAKKEENPESGPNNGQIVMIEKVHNGSKVYLRREKGDQRGGEMNQKGKHRGYARSDVGASVREDAWHLAEHGP